MTNTLDVPEPAVLPWTESVERLDALAPAGANTYFAKIPTNIPPLERYLRAMLDTTPDADRMTDACLEAVSRWLERGEDVFTGTGLVGDGGAAVGLLWIMRHMHLKNQQPQESP